PCCVRKTPTLPYTTLFRSLAQRAIPVGVDQLGLDGGERVEDLGHEARPVDARHARADDAVEREDVHVVARAVRERREQQRGLEGDRKSTRLNSSHVKTSYA